MILHDLCKTEEMDSNDMGVVRDYSREGLLLGHLVLGVNRIQEAANELGISGEPVLLLQHMMLSHHGEAEFGSPRKPMFPEAEALHWVDLLDARMNEMQTAIQKLKPGRFQQKRSGRWTAACTGRTMTRWNRTARMRSRRPKVDVSSQKCYNNVTNLTFRFTFASRRLAA